MQNIVLRLSFNGTNYCGWQRQAQANTVQGCVERAIENVIGEQVKLIGCSRTDSGVHAYEFVCNFFTKSCILPQKLTAALNDKLNRSGESIVVLKSQYASQSFHSRFGAKNKTYVYKIWNSAAKNPFLNNLAYTISNKLDIEEMINSTNYFVGWHDFAAFAASGVGGKNTYRNINYLSIHYRKFPLIEIEINAKCFLYNMVRIIAGTILNVGIKKITPKDISKIMLAKKRQLAGPTVPACGLYLKNVEY